MKRLYVATVTREIKVYFEAEACKERDLERLAEEYAKEEEYNSGEQDCCASVREVGPGQEIESPWDGRSLIYGTKDDKRLSDAIAELTGKVPQ